MASIQSMNAKLDFCIQKNKNVLFIGKHGVGKTGMVVEAFDRHKLNWRYFSASTIDPWVDFIGVPREKTDNKIPEQFEIIKELASIQLELAYEWVQSNWKMTPESAKKIVQHTLNRKQGLTYLDLVRPETFANGEIEGLFFDEYNRSPKKVRNAVMELIQFKSINGMKFPKLRFIWAAINPEDDEQAAYDVERLDPAQEDRFQMKYVIPYKPNAEWFRNKYTPRIADAATQWWDELSPEFKNYISPRRLQYALDVYGEHGDVRDVLPKECNVGTLLTALNTGPITEKLEHLMKNKDVGAARSFLQCDNNYSAAMKYIPKSPTLTEYFVPLLPKEKIAALLSSSDAMFRHIIENSDKVPVFMTVAKEVMAANTDARVAGKIRKALQNNQDLAKSYAANDNKATNPDEPYFTKSKGGADWSVTLAELELMKKDTHQQQIVVYDKIVAKIPEQQSADQALKCLTLLDGIVNSNKFASSISAKPFENLMGIVNHCVAEIQRNTGYNWTTLVTKHGSHFQNLLEKIKLGGLSNRMLTPI